MGTSVNNKCKAFTSLEQSKKLAEILPLESADMHYLSDIEKIGSIVRLGKPYSKTQTPAWSLAALFELIPNYQLQTQDNGIGILFGHKKGFEEVTAKCPIRRLRCYDREVTRTKTFVIMQQCYASISNTGLHCAWCVTRNDDDNSQAFCEKHNKPCEELNYYCTGFIGYKPDYRMTDEEEQQLINELRNK